MEENNREENNIEESGTSYTGEYGNAIHGEYEKEDTTYRFSYQNSSEAESTHSGDYYATQQESAGKESYGFQKEQETDGYQTDTSWGNSGHVGETADNQNSQNGQNFQNGQGFQNNQNFQNNQRYQGYQGYQPGSAFTGQNPKKTDGSGFGKKLLITVACAVIFGLVAGVCFNGFSWITNRNTANNNGSGEKAVVENSSEKKDTEKSTKTESNTGQSTEKNDVATIAEQAMPAVVAITSTSQGMNYYDLFGQYYKGQDTTSSGTGFIVGQNEKELLIATNNHVIEGAKTISVQFIDGQIYEAQKKGADSANDLAVIAVTVSKVKKTTMDQIKIADLGNSDKAKVGEMVIAIGNALGYGQSVTVGYISAKDREITEENSDGTAGKKIKALQTDAAINPGNSGGALINMQGQVIGINSAKIASSSVEGVGYAIPISVATPIIDELMNKEILSDDEKGYLGISGTEVTEQASLYNMPYGVYVKEVAKHGAADKAGILPGDVITAVNKAEVTTMTSLQEKVNGYRKGTKVEITLQRSDDGKYKEKKVTVELQGEESLDSLGGVDSNEDSSQGSDGQNGSGDSGNNNNSGENPNDNGQGKSGEDDDFGSFWDFFR